MKKIVILLSLLFIMSGCGGDTTYSNVVSEIMEEVITYWVKSYGGTSNDRADSIQQTTDGGFIVVGTTDSFGAAADNLWIMKVDPNGNITWQKSFGGTSFDRGYSVEQTGDGGYIVAGDTMSYGTFPGARYMWVIRLDADGNSIWQRTYGLDGVEVRSVQQTSEGGYIVAGSMPELAGPYIDAWIIKLDQTGNTEWNNFYSGAYRESFDSIQQTADGGYIAAGYSDSLPAGNGDFLVMKLNPDGNIIWQRTYGGLDVDRARSIRQTTDGGYIVTGEALSFGNGDFYDSHFWVLKLDPDGNIDWQNSFGGDEDDWASSVSQTSDGGYIVSGATTNFGAGVWPTTDAWIIKLDADGNIDWQKTYGGTGSDYARSVQQTIDGGYIAAGYTSSFGAGSNDLWILKLKPDGTVSSSAPSYIGNDTFVSVETTSITPIDASLVITAPVTFEAFTGDLGTDTTALIQTQAVE